MCKQEKCKGGDDRWRITTFPQKSGRSRMSMLLFPFNADPVVTNACSARFVAAVSDASQLRENLIVVQLNELSVALAAAYIASTSATNKPNIK
jgi:hypothetical protein